MNKPTLYVVATAAVLGSFVGCIVLVTKLTGDSWKSSPSAATAPGPPPAPRPERLRPLPAEPWKLVRNIGNVRIVVVDQARAKDQDLYHLAIPHVCGPGWCKALFWSDPAMTPAHLPMTAEQEGAMLVSWTHNPDSGSRELLWNCRAFPEAGRDECFSTAAP